jgi:hypothetical protein
MHANAVGELLLGKAVLLAQLGEPLRKIGGR